MVQIKTKSSFVARRPYLKNEITKLTKHLPSKQKTAILRASKVLAELSSSERLTALDLLRQKNENGGLDYLWLANFLTSLTRLKAEQNQSKAE